MHLVPKQCYSTVHSLKAKLPTEAEWTVAPLLSCSVITTSGQAASIHVSLRFPPQPCLILPGKMAAEILTRPRDNSFNRGSVTWQQENVFSTCCVNPPIQDVKHTH